MLDATTCPSAIRSSSRVNQFRRHSGSASALGRVHGDGDVLPTPTFTGDEIMPPVVTTFRPTSKINNGKNGLCTTARTKSHVAISGQNLANGLAVKVYD